MMKKIFFIFLFMAAAVVAVFPFVLHVPAESVQGGVITVLIEDALPGEAFEFELVQGDDVHSRTNAFQTDVSVEDLFVGLLGVPSTLRPGACRVSAVSADGEVHSSVIRIVQKTFISEDIPLSRSMSSLRQSDDIRKAEQWRNLLVILKTADSEHVFEDGGLDLPVKDYLRTSSFYGDRRRFVYDDGTTARSIHNGIDYSAEPGTPIYAAGRGRIAFSGERIISGHTVVIEHLPGVYSLYYHMNSRTVDENEMIEAGGLIGTVGATGLATGAHLHWEVRVGGVAVDPEPLMTGDIIDKDFILSNIEEQ
ncbi:MAG: M23 family metallopeptidase [Spirochaetales bacterium]|uniref:M23 family metallopeptidase n=1 Tax=Candidatus Thalassospirochaeta sargassi TaxID=3119039 RepID=A0AAJ1MIH4_9SPIO|nr:M23 family metallopeptidase [Spirochaetales bacterium]